MADFRSAFVRVISPFRLYATVSSTAVPSTRAAFHAQIITRGHCRSPTRRAHPRIARITTQADEEYSTRRRDEACDATVGRQCRDAARWYGGARRLASGPQVRHRGGRTRSRPTKQIKRSMRCRSTRRPDAWIRSAVSVFAAPASRQRDGPGTSASL